MKGGKSEEIREEKGTERRKDEERRKGRKEKKAGGRKGGWVLCGHRMRRYCSQLRLDALERCVHSVLP